MTEKEVSSIKHQTLMTRGIDSKGVSKKIDPSRILTWVGIACFLFAFGFYYMIQQVFLSFLFLTGGIACFGIGQLVRRSLQSTVENGSLSSGASVLEELQEIQKQVSKSKFFEHCEELGTRAALQGDQLLNRYKLLQGALVKKFEITELTYSRYSQAIDTISLSIAENLLQAKALLETLNIKVSHSKKSEESESVIQILDSTNEALEKLSELHKALTVISTRSNSRAELEDSINQIKLLTDRAKNYSIK